MKKISIDEAVHPLRLDSVEEDGPMIVDANGKFLMDLSVADLNDIELANLREIVEGWNYAREEGGRK